MIKRIGHDLFATVMRLPSRDRTDILEFLGQSPVRQDAVCLTKRDPAGLRDRDGNCPVGFEPVDPREHSGS